MGLAQALFQVPHRGSRKNISPTICRPRYLLARWCERARPARSGDSATEHLAPGVQVRCVSASEGSLVRLGRPRWA